MKQDLNFYVMNELDKANSKTTEHYLNWNEANLQELKGLKEEDSSSSFWLHPSQPNTSTSKYAKASTNCRKPALPKKARFSKEDLRKIFVGGIPYDVTEGNSLIQKRSSSTSLTTGLSRKYIL
jgi:hypothetical protein